jgi:O-Antigen ligase/Tetratricopeptide repeat
VSNESEWRGLALAVLIAGAAFWLAYDGGTYSLESRTATAIVLWSALLTAVVFGVPKLGRPPNAALVAGGLLALYALVTGLALVWAPSAERVVAELDRVMLFAGCFAVAALAGTRRNAGRWADGLAIGLTAVGTLAVASRFFPGSFPDAEPPEFLSRLLIRLSYPLDYWNGLAILVALAVPLLLRAATERSHAALRGLALAPFPALAATIYLTSSRGGFLTACVGVAVFLGLAGRRWSVAVALLAATPGVTLVVLALIDRPALANAPSSAEAAAEGKSAAAIVLAACAGTAVAYGLLVRLVPAFEPGRRAGLAATALVVAGAIAGIVALDPVERFEQFKNPRIDVERGDDAVREHLFSGGGSGRWQFWSAAVDEWQEDPILGHGPGTYEAWWARDGTLQAFVRDAHSLYLETLAELGVVGLVLIAGAFGTGLVAGVRRTLRGPPAERQLRAALVASFAAYLAAAAIDWMWELTVVSIVGMVLLGLLTGTATAGRTRERASATGREARRARPWLLAGALVIGLAVVAAQAVLLLSHLQVERSQAASARGDRATALEAARAARDLQPWAASPRIQLALVHEDAGRLEQAAAEMQGAVERDPENWRPYYLRARILFELGAAEAAEESFELARRLNPRSPIWR